MSQASSSLQVVLPSVSGNRLLPTLLARTSASQRSKRQLPGRRCPVYYGCRHLPVSLRAQSALLNGISTFSPNPDNKAVYDQLYVQWKDVYKESALSYKQGQKHVESTWPKRRGSKVPMDTHSVIRKRLMHQKLRLEKENKMFIVNENDFEYRCGDHGPKYLMKGPRMD